MRIASVCVEACSGHSGHPKEKVSRHTVRPGTLGLTLDISCRGWYARGWQITQHAKRVALF
jgi:hypothetical protein